MNFCRPSFGGLQKQPVSTMHMGSCMTEFDVCASSCTGKERDIESGNDYFGARYYASSMGRFLTPDWSKNPQGVPYADYTNPQSLNLYAYVDNNPLRAADPDGHVPICSDNRDGDAKCFEENNKQNQGTQQQGDAPPVPVPGGTPGTKWKWNPDEKNSRGGTWGPDKWDGKTQGSPPNASLDKNPGKNGVVHWDVKNGKGNTDRYDVNGKPLTPEQAHGRAPIPFSIQTAGWLLGTGTSAYIRMTNSMQNLSFPNAAPTAIPGPVGGPVPPPLPIWAIP